MLEHLQNSAHMNKLTSSSPPLKTRKRAKIASFLRSLAQILSESDQQVVGWTPNGRAFCIYDQTKFEQDILPLYFKHCKYASFQRQLNYFGFRKWTKSTATTCTYSQDYFLRDSPHEMENIRRMNYQSADRKSRSQHRRFRKEKPEMKQPAKLQPIRHPEWQLQKKLCESPIEEKPQSETRIQMIHLPPIDWIRTQQTMYPRWHIQDMETDKRY